MKSTTALAVMSTVAAVALTQMSLASLLAGVAIGGIGFALMPRSTIQR